METKLTNLNTLIKLTDYMISEDYVKAREILNTACEDFYYDMCETLDDGICPIFDKIQARLSELIKSRCSNNQNVNWDFKKKCEFIDLDVTLAHCTAISEVSGQLLSEESILNTNSPVKWISAHSDKE